ncbi:MAG: hypothetical protein GFH27_549289n125 [Chloroflexi bacterium AL-W]|nr:hypothetical protein [Chloroflexi bacterium AL-N1]NOK66857.1 hypothetical protein [Chloroflexi bacterium AL-N10]NOK74851.1 hypothetical protein [Chloroflexi bacterium AL-N5]NOK81460.1 hypothetical protein [Chloroflexi bacterium AL-W]NOK88929.1 hypothetical protein [Chloroflexi bacterium AL-N15]
MDKDWENWREYIKKRLNEEKILKCSDLEYQAIVRGYGTFGRSIIDYAFWRFAREHQETVRYVFVYDKITNISYDYYTPKNKAPFPVRELVLLNDFSPDKYVMRT